MNTIYSPTSNFHINDVSAGNKVRFLIDTSGNVGIGTTNPGAKLHTLWGSSGATKPSQTVSAVIETNSAADGLAFLQNDEKSTRIIFGGPSQSPSGIIEYFTSATAANRYLSFGVNGGEQVRITNAGNVGIGTTTPLYKLSVSGIASVDDYVRASYFTATSTTATSTFPRLTASSLFGIGTASYISDTATSTFSKGISLSSGCYAINGVCIREATSTVTSVAMTVPTGLTISGSPVTSQGTLAVSLDTGYIIPTSTLIYNLNNFYNTPSQRITAGTYLSWTGNTLNAFNVVTSTQPLMAQYFVATSTSATSTLPLLSVTNLGIGSNSYFSDNSTSTLSKGIDLRSGCFAINGVCVGSGGIASLGPLGQLQTGASQLFATTSDTNIGLTITSSGNTHTFTSQWIGNLAVIRGGTGLTSYTAGDMLYAINNNTLTKLASSTDGKILQLAYGTGAPSWVSTSSLGLLGSSTLAQLTQNYIPKWNGSIFNNSLIYDTGTNVGIGTTNPSSKLDVTTASLGTTQTTSSGLALVNTTAAAAGAQQISPAIRWSGFGWKTDATAASQAVDFRSFVVPVQGTANPTGYLTFQSSVNAAAYGDRMVITSGGNVGIGTTGPAGKLEVTSATAGTTVGDLLVDSANRNVYIGRLSSTTGESTTFFVRNRLGTNFMEMGGGNDYINFGTQGTSGNAMRITTEGNVGIGTTSPSTRLYVSGDAATQITVNGTTASRTVFAVGGAE